MRQLSTVIIHYPFKVIQTNTYTKNLTLSPSKFQFFKREAKILGFIVGNNEIKTDPKKIEALRKYPIPSASSKKLKQILGLVGFYQRFIKNFAKITKPLFNLLKKTTPFVWSDECQQAFEAIT